MRPPAVPLGLLIAALTPGPALADRIRLPVHPYDEQQAESGRDPAPALPVEVRLSVPDAGRFERDTDTTWSWTGQRDRAGCRVWLTLEARAVTRRDPDIESGQPPRASYSREGLRIAVASPALDDTRSPFGYARFRLPDALAPSTDHRLVYVLITSNRGQGHCIRRTRTRGSVVVRRSLRTIAVHPR